MLSHWKKMEGKSIEDKKNNAAQIEEGEISLQEGVLSSP